MPLVLILFPRVEENFIYLVLSKFIWTVKKIIVCLRILVTCIYCISAYLLYRILVSLHLDIDWVPGESLHRYGVDSVSE